MIKRAFQYTIVFFFIYAALCLFTPFSEFLTRRSIEGQIHYLSDLLDAGYDDELQRRFPEGKVFSNSLLALAITEYANVCGLSDRRYSRIVDQCIVRLLSPKTLQIFNDNLEPEYGIFYRGWTNLVFSSYLKSDLIKSSEMRKEVDRAYADFQSEMARLQADTITIFDTYIGAYWPADNMMGICAMEDEQVRRKWIKLLFSTSQHPLGLIHHTGSQNTMARGSSSAMILYGLAKCQWEGAKEYDDQYQDIFVHSFLGLELVKENEDGSNRMDADSGPVFLGYGAAATIMNIKAQSTLKNSNAKITWAFMNLLALPIHLFGRKYYLFQKEPMLDLFMLWASTDL